MRLARATTLGVLLLGCERAGAQSAGGNDSLSTLSPAQRYAEICPGPREAGTGAIVGRVRDIDDSTALANATVSTQWIDVKNTKGHLSSASTRTSNSGFYLLCGVPTQMRVNLRSERGGYIASPAQLVLDEQLISSMDFSLRRLDRVGGDSLALPRAQKLAAVAIDEKAALPSLMEQHGFETRRQQAMGAFVTEQEIRKHTFSDLTSILQGVRGITIERSGRMGMGSASVFMMGVMSVHHNQSRCTPNVFLDGAPFPSSSPNWYEELSQIAHPEAIKGVEVYSNPGTIPAQYDLMSSTGCGSIVIWTR